MRSQQKLAVWNRMAIRYGLAIIMLLCSSLHAQGDELISCKYEKAQGKQVTLRLEVGSPPPAMVIVVQRLPKEVTITKTTPAAHKYNRHTGEAKWLLKRVRPGSLLLTMDLDGGVTPEQISGEIRFKNPHGGKMEVMPIKP